MLQSRRTEGQWKRTECFALEGVADIFHVVWRFGLVEVVEFWLREGWVSRLKYWGLRGVA